MHRPKKVKQEGSVRDKEILSLIDTFKTDMDAFLLFYKEEFEKLAFKIFLLEQSLSSVKEELKTIARSSRGINDSSQ